MKIENKYNFGDFVFLKTDIDQLKRIVSAITARPNGSVMYELMCGTEGSWHQEIEITKVRNQVMQLGLEEKETN